MKRPADAAIWYRALYLHERVALHRDAASTPGPASERARQRVERWRDGFAVGAEVFQRRLGNDGLDEDSLAVLLDEPSPAVLDGFVDPPWLGELRAAYDVDASAAPALTLADLPGPLGSHQMVGLLEAAMPLLGRAHAAVLGHLVALQDARLAAGRSPAFEPRKLADQLFATLPGLVLRMLSRTLILEMHVARLSGALTGDSAEERYSTFVAGLRDRAAVWQLFGEYPVLARSLAETMLRWVAVSRELASRLAADIDELVAVFGGGSDPGEVVAIDCNAGDTHRGGRGVAILRFASGLKLVYKPRSLRGDTLFQDMCAWLDRRGSHPRFRLLGTLDRGEYGWAEFIVQRPCTSVEEAARFFERQGAYLALFHALEANDIHYENLIAYGEYPVPVDLESLFQPRIVLGDADSALRAAEKLAQSVLRVGLLPNRRYTDEKEEDVDLGGLSSVKGMLTPYKQHFFEGAGTDEMRMVRKRLPMDEARNMPTIDGKELSVLDHEKDFMRGFVAMYQLFVEHRDEILAADGPLVRFAGVPIRILLRPTRVYSMVFRESFHPDVLRDAVDRDRLFDKLWEVIELQPRLERVIRHEIADLRQGDIPMFTGQPDSRDILDSRDQVIADMLADTGMARSRQRISDFGDADRDEQVWFAQSSLATVAMSLEGSDMAWYRFREGASEAEPRELAAAARAVGDRLCELAIAGDRDVTWLGMAVNHEKWLLAPLESSLYTGLAGPLLFLAYLGAETGVAAYTELAERVHHTLRERIRNGKHLLFAPGAFSGWAGIAYVEAHLAVLWDRPQLFEHTQAVVDEIEKLLPEESHADVLYGTAGAIMGLLMLDRMRPQERLRALAIQCGERLLAQAQPMPRGLGWIIGPAGNRALAGFSHGAAGIAWALSHLAEATGDGRFRDGARAAMEFERGVYSAKTRNWPDLREPARPPAPDQPYVPPSICAWCHGAAGIGMARLSMAGFAGDPEIEQEIAIALDTTRARGFGGNHCLCHGDLGNLELLFLAAEKRGDASLRREAYRRARGILDGASEHGWLCGVPLGVETPGFMNGLAGIGYELLRLSSPATVPSVLMLAPPPGMAGRHRG